MTGSEPWRQLLCWTPGGDVDLAATMRALPADDMHAAAMVRSIWARLLHHVPGPSGKPGRWHVWDGWCHRPDESALIGRVAMAFASWYETAIEQVRAAQAAATASAAGGTPTDKQIADDWKPWEPYHRYAAGLRRSGGLGAMLNTLGMACGISETDLEDKTAFPGLLNTPSCTFDFTTRAGREHDPADMITYCLDVPYDPAARCPKYQDLVLRACGGNVAVARYLVKVLGYSVMVGNPEQLIFFLQGPTASGKSALLNCAVQVMGPLAVESTVDLVTVQKQRNARVENSIRGKRLVTITETSGFLMLDEAQLKRLTGEKHIAVHRHYAGETVRTRVTWVIIIATNEMPSLANPDEALKRRMIVIPMGASIPEWEWIKDIDEKIIAEESAGILTLLAAGAMAALDEGLDPPPEVVAATAQYHAEQNSVENFVRDWCALSWPQNGQGPPTTGFHQMNVAYDAYCRKGPRLGPQEFKRQLSRYPGVRPNEHRRWYEGIELKSEALTEIGG